jgi:hypothetical protein
MVAKPPKSSAKDLARVLGDGSVGSRSGLTIALPLNELRAFVTPPSYTGINCKGRGDASLLTAARTASAKCGCSAYSLRPFGRTLTLQQ